MIEIGTELIVASRFCAVTMMSASIARVSVAGPSVWAVPGGVGGGCCAACWPGGFKLEGTVAVCAAAGESDKRDVSGSAAALRMKAMRDMMFPLLIPSLADACCGILKEQGGARVVVLVLPS